MWKTEPFLTQTTGGASSLPLVMTCRVRPLKVSVLTLVFSSLSSWASLVALVITASIFSAFEPASAWITTATGVFPSALDRIASDTAPVGRVSSSLSVTPTLSLRTLLASSSFSMKSSSKSFIAGSARSWPKEVFSNASRIDAASLILAKNRVEFGSESSGPAARPEAAVIDMPARPRQAASVRRTTARNGVRIDIHSLV